MKKSIALGLFACACIACSPSKKEYQTITTPTATWELEWNDEFDYTGLPDSSRWSYDTVGNSWGWGNNEKQHYTAFNSENASVANGILSIVALKKETEGKDYSSARLITKHKGDWLYGRFEIRAKLPSAKGTWPAIWMLPTDWEYGKWPVSGEIDIMENVGYDPDTILATAHTQTYNHSIGTQTSGKLSVPTCSTQFHTYSLEWDEYEWRAYVDDIHYYTHKNEGNVGSWPFDKRFHLILNLAIGGDWGGKYGIDDTAFPQIMEVDYVRVYKKSK